MYIKNLKSYLTPTQDHTSLHLIEFTWQVINAPSDGLSFQIIIMNDAGKKIFESAWSSSSEPKLSYNGEVLKEFNTYFWYVAAKQVSTLYASPVAQFHCGPRQWDAEWITPLTDEGVEITCPVVISPLIKIEKEIQSAHFYASACGLYKAFLNEERIGDIELAPGWSSYDKQIYFQCYDITKQLQSNQDKKILENKITIWLADGWFRGQLFTGDIAQKNSYGEELASTALLIISYRDGTQEIIKTDNTWYSSLSPITFASIYHGEHYDARLGALVQNETQRIAVKKSSNAIPKPIQQWHEPIRVIQVKPLSTRIRTPKGENVIDMGQNMVGRVRIKVQGKAGTIVKLFHAEIFDADGNFYTQNLRDARQEIIYILSGDGIEEYAPSFTFMGFRYVKLVVEGYPLISFELVGEVLSSDLKKVGKFRCNNHLINQLVSNIEWGMRGNFLDVPTDCPQRDERLGWTADTQVFTATASYLAHTPLFYHKWINDFVSDQRANGVLPHVAPDICRLNTSKIPEFCGSSGWADAITVVPWEVYQFWNYQPILQSAFPAMKKWVEYVKARSRNLIWFAEANANTIMTGGDFSFGDWVPPIGESAMPNPTTGGDLISTAYFARSAHITAKTAEVLGYKDDAAKYFELFQDIKKSIAEEFITNRGRLLYNSQTAYCMMLAWDLCPENVRPTFEAALALSVIKSNYKIATGFLGTPLLLKTLCAIHRPDLAMKILLQEKCPSWLYEVKLGATTVWERWDGMDDQGRPFNPGMNSYNHYAFGAVGEWLFSHLAGIRSVESAPGFKEILFEPVILPEFNIHRVEAEHECNYGIIKAQWHYDTSLNQVEYLLTVPTGTSARVNLPKSAQRIFCNGVETNGLAATILEGGKNYLINFILVPNSN